MEKKGKILMVIVVIIVIAIAALGWYVFSDKMSFKTDQPIATGPAIKVNNTLETSVTVLPAPGKNP